MSSKRTLGALCASLLILACAVACERTRPAAPKITPALDGEADAAPLATPRGEAPKRVEDASAPATDRSAAQALEVATEERRVFRRLLVGALQYPPRRYTWVLYRGVNRAHLDLFCQTGTADSARGMRLNGEDSLEESWHTPSVLHYSGRPSGAPSTYRFTAEDTPHGVGGCAHTPAAFTMVCRLQKVAVRSAGVVLIPVVRHNDDTQTAEHWSPPGEQLVEVLRCEVQTDADAPSWFLTNETALAFSAGSPGIEWAYENSDMVAQAGTYRGIVPPP